MTTPSRTTKRTLAIFGAGTGLGASVAARFGREGYRIALVARRAGPLEDQVAELGRANVESVAFPADLTNLAAIPALVRSIEEKWGAIDVAIYAPVTPELGFVPAVDLDAAKLQAFAKLFLFAPVEVFHAVLPGMLTRGDGAIILGGGLTAVHTMAGMSGAGVVMAAARNYLFTLNAEVKPKGIYAGTVTIGALINRSAGHRVLTASGVSLDRFPMIDPDTIAEEIWSLVTKRERIEAVLPPMPAA
jgi:short-subunit dehydrogenase